MKMLLRAMRYAAMPLRGRRCYDAGGFLCASAITLAARERKGEARMIGALRVQYGMSAERRTALAVYAVRAVMNIHAARECRQSAAADVALFLRVPLHHVTRVVWH